MVANEIEKLPYNVKCTCVVVKTQGDKNQISPIDSFGGKAVFVDEFEQILLNGDIDIAVHSAKDMPIKIANGLEIGAVLKRADVRDVLIYKKETEKIKTIGTSSKRRTAQILKLYPNCECLALRGNVPTRIEKMKNSLYDAVVLAKAGLDRLDIFGKDDSLCYQILSVSQVVPAACQGIIAVECRENDLKDILNAINDKATMQALIHEREIMNLLDSSCTQAVGAVETQDKIIVMKKIADEIRKKEYVHFDLQKIKKDFM